MDSLQRPSDIPSDGIPLLQESPLDLAITKIDTVVDGHRKVSIIMLDGQAAIGTVSLALEPDEDAVLSRLFVDEKYRGRGIGKGLVLKACEIAKREKFRAAVLHVQRTNKAAKALYESMGFRRLTTAGDKQWMLLELFE